MAAKQAQTTSKEKTTKAANGASSTSRATSRKTSTRKTATSKKATVKKAATKKSATKAAEKTTAKTTTKKASPKRTTKSTSQKAAAKPKTATKKTVAAKKSAAKKTDASTPEAQKTQSVAKTASTSVENTGDDKTSVKTPVMKNLNVGQKPPSERASQIPVPTSLPTSKSVDQPKAEETQKPTAESKAAKQTFRVNDYVVYPAHGVGKIASIEKQMIAGVTNELFLIVFEHEKMKLRVPTAKAQAVGMRPLSEEATVVKAIDLLKGRARIKRTMWSRRAQEYEAKINSGDIIQVAEVVRDLFRASDQPEQSYSERQLFEAAQDRLAREVAAVRKTDLGAAISALDASLQQKAAA